LNRRGRGSWFDRERLTATARYLKFTSKISIAAATV